MSVTPGPGTYGPDRLSTDLALRLATGDIEFELGVQRYVSEQLTPVEDTSKRWVGPWEPVARLIVPRQDLDTAEARLIEHRVGQLAFNPWNTTEEFRPLGNLNRARRGAYEASSAHRLGQRFIAEQPRQEAVLNAVADSLFKLVNLVVPWHRLPTPLRSTRSWPAGTLLSCDPLTPGSMLPSCSMPWPRRPVAGQRNGNGR